MITVIYCTREPNKEHTDHLRRTSGLANKIEIIEVVNKGESLTVAYNKALKKASNEIVVFCHDDILMNTKSWGRKLLKQFATTDYGILGLAGTTNLPENGKWWEDRTKMVGIVKHSQNGKTWESKYSGNFTDRVIETVIVDGLFLAIHTGRVKESFDETVEGFHFYEVDYCYRNHLAGTKVGVIFNVKVTHKSVGETNEQWEANRVLFAEKFKDSLPTNIDVELFDNTKELKLKSEPNVKIILSSGGDIEKTKRFIDTISGFDYSNYTISVVVEEELVESYETLNSDVVTVYESNFNIIHKDLSVLRWDDDFIGEGDELVMFASDNMVLETNLLKKFVSTYLKDKKRFGCMYPRVLNNDKTIVSTGVVVSVIVQGDQQMLSYALKGFDSYYNYQEGIASEAMGNLGFCFMTTYANLVANNWFRLDFERTMYEVDFAAKCALKGKLNFVDADSIVRLDYNFTKDETKLKELNDDFEILIKAFNESPEAQQLVRVIRMPKQRDPVAVNKSANLGASTAI